MDKNQAIQRILANPGDVPALDCASEIAVQEQRWNEALSLASRAVRIEPKLTLFRRLAYVTSRLGFALSTAAYLLAALRVAPEGELKSKTLAEWEALRETLLKSSQQVRELHRRMVFAREAPPEIWRRIQASPLPAARISEYEQLLSRHALSLPLSFHLAAELIQANRIKDSIHVSTAAMLHGDISLPTLVNLVGAMIKWRRGRDLVPLAQATVNLFPASAGAWANLGGAFDLHRRPWESINACEQALKLDPSSVVALNNLGNSRKNAGDPTSAAQAYEHALVILDWSDRAIFSNYLLTLQYALGYTREQKAEAHFRYGHLFKREAHLPRRALVRGRDRLKVGFVSADFVNHSVAYFLLPLWDQLSERGVEIVAYHNNSVEDAVSQSLKGKVAQWHNIHAMEDDQVAELIRGEAVDVLLDPAGHTSRNRLGVFGSRSAPVQLTWLGHPNTTGLRQMDWRVTDAHCDPQGVEHLYTEKLYRMPGGLFCVYRPLVNRPTERYSQRYAVRQPPALEKGHVTFGSCNNIAKITDPVVAVWSQILAASTRSRLLIESPGLSQREFRDYTLKRFSAHGVGPERLDLRERDGHRQYLIYNEIDICLDPFPCNGGTTTFDLLWMGVPLITLQGDSFVSRMGASLLASLGRTQWIADSEAEYVQRALTLACDLPNLERERETQRARMECSPLMDERGFGEQFNELLWSLALTGEAPQT